MKFRFQDSLRSSSTCSPSRRGAACVEFAIVLPLLLVLLLGTMEFGSALRMSHQLSGAVHEGGRRMVRLQGIGSTNTNQAIVDEITEALKPLDARKLDLKVEIRNAQDQLISDCGDATHRGQLLTLQASTVCQSAVLSSRNFLSGKRLEARMVVRMPDSY
jgi:Flp pilus assembly protein TadG